MDARRRKASGELIKKRGEEAIIKNIKTYVNEPEGYKLDIDNETWVWPKIAFEG